MIMGLESLENASTRALSGSHQQGDENSFSQRHHQPTGTEPQSTMKIFNLEIRRFLAIKVILAHREKQELFLGCNYTCESPGGGWEGQGLIQKFPPHCFPVLRSPSPLAVNCRAQGALVETWV